MEKAHLTLYTVIGSPQHILTGIQSLFAPVIQSVDTEADQIRVTLQDDSLLVFHLSHVREKAGFIEMHIEGMANYFAQAATSNPALKENVLRQIRCFNCVVGIVFETDDNNDRTRYLINTLFDLAHQVKGYLLYPNMHLYDGEGKLVFSREGESELTEFTPIAHADLLDGDRPEETSADRERRERSVALLQTQGIPYLETLKSEVPETEVHLKSREEMMQRAATLFVVAVYSEVMLSENPDRNEALTYFNKMDEIYGIQSWLTPAEAAYISNPGKSASNSYGVMKTAPYCCGQPVLSKNCLILPRSAMCLSLQPSSGNTKVSATCSARESPEAQRKFSTKRT